MVDEQTARGYLEKLTAIASPIMLYYYGMALSHGGKNGGSNFIKNNYDDAVLYLEYAANCYMEEAKKSLEDWEKLLRS